jgi:N-acetyl-alpha-D-muramate 1-phosphate uridylyltransferase
MNALIFAAGFGKRMLPLTASIPKPLLNVGGKLLIEWHLQRLAAAGIRQIVINTAHFAEQFPAALGDGSPWGVNIRYSHEGDEPLETGGGMLNALPLLGAQPFVAVNADIWTDFDFSILPQDPQTLAHLVMVENPHHHLLGDFVLRDGLLHDEPSPRLTFAGIGVYRPELLDGLVPGRYSIVPTLRAAMRAGRISGEHYPGDWSDIGTPQRLAELERRLGGAGR